jgi:phosphotriesterase-related protein
VATFNLTGKVQTVLGTIAPDQLGVTLTHEHLLLDFRCVFTQPPGGVSQQKMVEAPVTMENLGWIRYHWTSNLENLKLFDEETAIAEAGLYARAGGGTIVDVTNIGIGRDPRSVARISRATGLNVVMGSGYYIGSVHPDDMGEKTEEEIADEIVKDITEGVGDTGIKAGIIGEIGCSWPWTENERKSVRGAALAQQRTGAGLTIHPGRYETAPLEIISVLQEVGADLKRTIMCHIERTMFDWETVQKLAQSGCYLEYDLFGHESSYYPLAPDTFMPHDAQRLDQIARLVAEGHLEQVLMAQDICANHRLTRYGGHGYKHILENIVPRMKHWGITEEQVQTILVENPRRVLTFV